MAAGLGRLTTLESVLVLLPDYRDVTAGISNVLHLAADFAACEGIDVTVGVIGATSASSVTAAARQLLGADPPFRVLAIPRAPDLEALRADLVVCTHWTTRDAALRVACSGTACFYQDDERLF
jgi:hypothetical protein